MPSRPQRVGDQVRAELCVLLQRSVRDPALRLVTVTHVKMTRDLQHAQVYYSAPDTAVPSDTVRGLRRAAPYLRGQLGHRLRLRHVPELTFVYDDSIAREQRVAEIIEGLQIERTPETDRDPVTS